MTTPRVVSSHPSSQAEHSLFRAADPVERTLILLHGRVDLVDGDGNLFSTVDVSMSPPLGELPLPPATPSTSTQEDGGDEARRGEPAVVKQAFAAMAAEPCLLLAGGVPAAEALSRLMALADEVEMPPEGGKPSDADAEPKEKPKMGLMQALAALQKQASSPAAPSEAAAPPQPAGG